MRAHARAQASARSQAAHRLRTPSTSVPSSSPIFSKSILLPPFPRRFTSSASSWRIKTIHRSNIFSASLIRPVLRKNTSSLVARGLRVVQRERSESRWSVARQQCCARSSPSWPVPRSVSDCQVQLLRCSRPWNPPPLRSREPTAPGQTASPAVTPGRWYSREQHDPSSATFMSRHSACMLLVSWNCATCRFVIRSAQARLGRGCCLASVCNARTCTPVERTGSAACTSDRTCIRAGRNGASCVRHDCEQQPTPASP